MKTLLILTSALVGGVMLPAVAFSEATRVLECEVRPVANGNWFVRVDPHCDIGVTTGAGIDPLVLALRFPETEEPVEPEEPCEGDDCEEPVDPIYPVDPIDPIDPVDPDPVDPDPVDPVDPVDPPTDTEPPVDQPGDGNNGHGNDPGKVDPSNPGNGPKND